MGRHTHKLQLSCKNITKNIPVAFPVTEPLLRPSKSKEFSWAAWPYKIYMQQNMSWFQEISFILDPYSALIQILLFVAHFNTLFQIY